jgi:hypothetical protein
VSALTYRDPNPAQGLLPAAADPEGAQTSQYKRVGSNLPTRRHYFRFAVIRPEPASDYPLSGGMPRFIQ